MPGGDAFLPFCISRDRACAPFDEGFAAADSFAGELFAGGDFDLVDERGERGQGAVGLVATR